MPQTVGTTHRKHLRHQRLDRYRKDRASRFSQWLARELSRLSVTSERALRDTLREIGLLSPAEVEGAADAAGANVLEATITATFADPVGALTGSPDFDFSAAGVSMSGTPDLTMSGGDTITRSAGDFEADGFAAGDVVDVQGAGLDPGNVGIFTVATVSGAVMTVVETLTNEGPISGATIDTVDAVVRSAGDFAADGFNNGQIVNLSVPAGSANVGNGGRLTIDTRSTLVLTFSAGASGFVKELAVSGGDLRTDHSIQRSAGDWAADGFVAGDRVRVSGSTDNDGDYTLRGFPAATIALVLADALTSEGPTASVVVSRIDADAR